jgi:hypothetical protein
LADDRLLLLLRGDIALPGAAADTGDTDVAVERE